MAVKVKCPSCGRPLSGPDELLGKTVKCPACQHQMRLPARATTDGQARSSPAPPLPAPPRSRSRSPRSSAASGRRLVRRHRRSLWPWAAGGATVVALVLILTVAGVFSGRGTGDDEQARSPSRTVAGPPNLPKQSAQHEGVTAGNGRRQAGPDKATLDHHKSAAPEVRRPELEQRTRTEERRPEPQVETQEGPVKPGSEAVVVDGAANESLGKLLLAAVVKLRQTPGRRITFGTSYSYSATGTTTATTYARPPWGYLPEKIVIPSEGGQCPATLGWEWEMKSVEVVGAEGEADVALEPPPSGSIMRLGGQLRLGKSQLPSGAILMRSETGWDVVTPAKASDRMRALLAVKYTEDYVKDDLRVVGALGAAVLGPGARDLAPTLKAVAKSNPEHQVAGFCAKALAAIGDKSALPDMRQMRDRAGAKPGIVDLIDTAIAELERLP